MFNERPRFDDVYVPVSLVADLYREGHQPVLHRDGMDDGICLVGGFVTGDLQLQVLVAIGVLHLQRGQMDGIYRTEGWKCREVQVVACIVHLLQGGRLAAEVCHTQVLSLVGV